MKKTSIINNARTISRPFSWVGAAVFLVSLISFWSAQNAHAAIYTFSVTDTVPWVDTGINVTSGSQVQITALGTVIYGHSAGQSCDANGGDSILGSHFFSDSVVPSAMTHSLIGRTGGTLSGGGTLMPEGTAGDGLGFVGTSYNKLISSGGELFLGFNDEVGGFSDNSGSFSVTVNVTPVPEPSVAALATLGGLAFFVWRMRRPVKSACAV